MPVCRICGVECAPAELLSVHEGGGCRHCHGSPTCSRCGHARGHHRGAFGGGTPGCNVEVAAEVGLAVGRCGCPGYTTRADAFSEPVDIVDVVDLRLRRPGDRSVGGAARAVRDLFDGSRRSHDASESGGVPWRPHE